MIALLQLVSSASVQVDGCCIGEIRRGMLVFVGIEKTDNENSMTNLFERIMNYRIFPDESGKTNLSVKDIGGGILLVPQFTLVADTRKGTRPGFSKGMPPEEGRKLFEYLVQQAKNLYPNIASGQFGAHMEVKLCNDGPVTFILQN